MDEANWQERYYQLETGRISPEWVKFERFFFKNMPESRESSTGFS